ncbi:hypothetical protein [Azospirillum sp. sgz302134]
MSQHRPRVALVLLLGLLGLGMAASPALAQQPAAEADKALVDACAHELGERQGGGHAMTVTSTEMERPNETTVRVKLSLTSGEGRLIQGTCVFRNGKLFDVRQ